MEIKDVEKLALLARLELSEVEKKDLLKDFVGILDYIKQIEKVEAVGPEPVEGGDTAPSHEVINVWREDTLEPRAFSKELITRQFPDAQDGFLKVKKIL